jgi:hypothetical protein
MVHRVADLTGEVDVRAVSRRALDAVMQVLERFAVHVLDTMKNTSSMRSAVSIVTDVRMKSIEAKQARLLQQLARNRGPACAAP